MPFLDVFHSMPVSIAESMLCRTALPFSAWTCSPKVSPWLFWFIYIRPKSWVWIWISSIYGGPFCVSLRHALSHFSTVRLCATPWTVARQAPLSMGFSRQGYWNGLPFPLQGNLTNPGTKPTSLMSPALAGWFFTTSATWEAGYKLNLP